MKNQHLDVERKPSNSIGRKWRNSILLGDARKEINICLQSTMRTPPFLQNWIYNMNSKPGPVLADRSPTLSQEMLEDVAEAVSRVRHMQVVIDPNRVGRQTERAIPVAACPVGLCSSWHRHRTRSLALSCLATPRPRIS
jgi:hypothetical protein